jgi:hypothetical protein
MIEIKKYDVASLLKQFNGEAVLTVGDIHSLTGCSRYSISYHIRYKLTPGSDYCTVSGADLKKFKTDNPSVLGKSNSMYAVTSDGFLKLSKILGFTIGAE